MKTSRRMAAVLTAAVIASIAPATETTAYQIYPLRPVHEAITRLAYACEAAAGAEDPLDCSGSYARLGDLTRRRPYRAFSEAEKAASWPDDPLREMTPSSAIR